MNRGGHRKILVAAITVGLLVVAALVAVCCSTDDDPPGPATLAYFVKTDELSIASAMEVSRPEQLDAFFASLHGGLSDGDEHLIRSVVENRPSNHRAFAFNVPGCQNTGAYLSISDERMHPVLTGGENVACARAVWYLAVFTLPAEAVPPTAKIG
ncbi:hypothetical protein JK358_09955 [Nocardia sp. 2]|uniref:Lipoprotein n=1 Tax=Nocardia acididurans TaxID=2802282 RepID=A0ABS1M315_9NOCA|nr:hypothetical protein [Nocardia acididurans]MBL1074721.1 hypothetical protein [Nocardia acididurans]